MGRRKKDDKTIIADKSLRDQFVKHFEVLEKVKDVLLLPGTDLMSIEQVANYYDVSVAHIRYLYGNNKVEIDNDGTTLIAKGYYSTNESSINPTSVKITQTQALYAFDDGETVAINNRGLKAFSRRAVLRIGMLLQKSDVAKEVRNQLLNIEEKVSSEVKTQDIEEEQRLALALGMAMASGNVDAIMIANANMMAFKNRYIDKLKNDNKALASEILDWEDRQKLNAGIRQLSSVTGVKFGVMWNELYKNLQYKYSINVKGRGNKPYLQWIKEDEWEKVVKTFAAMCEAYGKSPTEMFQQTTPVEKLKSVV